MAFYLVRAKPRKQMLGKLKEKLAGGEVLPLEPFGRTLDHSLRNARWDNSETAVWEEEDYCTPPLAQEREAVLDEFFGSIGVEQVREGRGWNRIAHLPRLFPELADSEG